MDHITLNNTTIALPAKKTNISGVIHKYLKAEDYQEYIAILNNEYASLNRIVTAKDVISTEQNFHDASRRAYENAAIITLQFSIEKLFPTKRLEIKHSICDGVYCEISALSKPDQNLIDQIRTKFQETVHQDLPILALEKKREEAIRLFRSTNRSDTAELLKNGENEDVTIYQIADHFYWLPAPPAPRTGLIASYQILLYQDGFILRLPLEGSPHQLPPFCNQDRLFEIFDEYETWGEILHVSSLSQLNALVKKDGISEMIKISEALHEKKIASIAEQIDRTDGGRRLIFVAGPSSSGKTTFMKRLYIQLRVLGYNVVTLSLDNYFKDRQQLHAEQGDNLNFETLGALDLGLLNVQLSNLLKGKKIFPPVYDFKKGIKIKRDKELKIGPHTAVIIEGIHGINPDLAAGIADEYKYKIYISALTHLNFDYMNRIPTHDARLLRRIVRDANFRGYSASETINMWKKVVEGEKRYIFRFQGTADIMFNSSLVYEIGALKPRAKAALLTITPNDPAYPESRRLLDFLSYFLTITENEIPPTSILREFIGNSSFEY